MKNALSFQSMILLFATLIALSITIGVGHAVGDATVFCKNTLLVNVTFMGDAFFAFGLIFFLLFFYNKKDTALKLLIAISITLFTTQVIKNIFSGAAPQLYFEEGIIQNANETVLYKNIISSHTAIAFTIASLFGLKIKNLFLKLILILLAFAVAFTRIDLAGDSLSALVTGLLPSSIASVYLYNIKFKKEISKQSYYYKSRKEINRIDREYLLGH